MLPLLIHSHLRIRLIDVLVDQFAFLPVEFRGVWFRQLFQSVQNRHADGGAGLLLFAPVKDDAFGFEGVEQFFGDLFDLLAFFFVEFDVGACEQIEDGEFFFVEIFSGAALFFFTERAGRCMRV